MHELVKNEKRESRARPLLQTRTGPTALSNSTSLSSEEKQQKRIAARAATAMAQVLQRRREPRSLMMWGDRKKAIIKNYPDGGQEIIVPQTLTPEQEHYEFPPRSRFLKKLATSTAERRRLSVLQDQVVPPSADLSPISVAPQSISTKDMLKPDQLALQEWFSKKDLTQDINKDRAVIDWMNDVERSSKSLLLLKQAKPSPTPSSCYSNKIQFKSDAGKRWANSITSNTSLIPPDDNCRKHYVPRRLLIQPKKNELDNVTNGSSKIRKIWKDYQSSNRHLVSTPAAIENQIGITAMASTGQRTPIGGMAQMLQSLHNSLKEREKRWHDRAEQYESLLNEETSKRQLAEETMKKWEIIYQQQQQQTAQPHEKEKSYQALLLRVTELEQIVKREGQSRKELEAQLLKATNSAARSVSRKSSVVSVRKSLAIPPVLKKPATLLNASVALQSSRPSVAQSNINRKPSPATHSPRKPLLPPPPPPKITTTTKKPSTRTSSLANAGVTPSLPKKTTTTTKRMTTVPRNKN
ncbi:hypothetical protein INT48_007144 [Thamnidium elegans]|uniref:Uncharacterized protein n=1 Tax=Thamnidium elegans TaxID=101142 RepID=A0A8H7VW32_9FUNG|nr:hypothetical protein INT48_007144 [Thamnidium elegans]